MTLKCVISLYYKGSRSKSTSFLSTIWLPSTWIQYFLDNEHCNRKMRPELIGVHVSAMEFTKNIHLRWSSPSLTSTSFIRMKGFKNINLDTVGFIFK